MTYCTKNTNSCTKPEKRETLKTIKENSFRVKPDTDGSLSWKRGRRDEESKGLRNKGTVAMGRKKSNMDN